MSKYDPLFEHLNRSGGMLELQFTDVEEILGFPLPASARRHVAWWSNSGGSHVQSAAWLAAGYKTAEVDIAGMHLRFVPDHAASGFSEMKQAEFKSSAQASIIVKPPIKREPGQHPLFGIWKGKVTLLPDYDYTQPADPDWGKVYEE